MYNNAIGRWGEDITSNYLSGKGYQILAKNVKLSNQELDLVCTSNGILVFIEVKTRTSSKLGSADEMLSRRKIKDFKIAASSWLRRKYHKGEIRFDFIALNVRRKLGTVKITHYKDII